MSTIGDSHSSCARNGNGDDDGERMPLEAFRSALRNALERAGMPLELRAHLRSRIISQLEHKSGALSLSNKRTRLGKIDASFGVVQTLSHIFIVDFMRRHGLEYSLSVFLPESGHPELPAVSKYEIVELLRLDGVPAHSATLKILNEFQKSENTDETLLESLVCGVRSIHHGAAHAMVQTEAPFPHLSSSNFESHDLALKSTELLIEDRIQKRVNEKLRELRDSEMRKVELEQKEKYASIIEAKRIEIEAAFCKREAELRRELEEARISVRDSEKEVKENLTHEKSELAMERHAFEAERLAWKSSQKINGATRDFEDNSLRRRNLELQRQIDKLRGQLSETDVGYHQNLKKLSASFEHQQNQILHQVKLQQMQLENEMASLESRRAEFERSERENSVLRRDLTETQTKLDHYLSVKIANQAATPDLNFKENNISEIKSLVDALRNQLGVDSSCSLRHSAKAISLKLKEMEVKLIEKERDCAECENKLAKAMRKVATLTKEAQQLKILVDRLSFSHTNYRMFPAIRRNNAGSPVLQRDHKSLQVSSKPFLKSPEFCADKNPNYESAKESETYKFLPSSQESHKTDPKVLPTERTNQGEVKPVNVSKPQANLGDYSRNRSLEVLKKSRDFLLTPKSKEATQKRCYINLEEMNSLDADILKIHEDAFGKSAAEISGIQMTSSCKNIPEINASLHQLGFLTSSGFLEKKSNTSLASASRLPQVPKTNAELDLARIVDPRLEPVEKADCVNNQNGNTESNILDLEPSEKRSSKKTLPNVDVMQNDIPEKDSPEYSTDKKENTQSAANSLKNITVLAPEELAKSPKSNAFDQAMAANPILQRYIDMLQKQKSTEPKNSKDETSKKASLGDTTSFDKTSEFGAGNTASASSVSSFSAGASDF